jgi:hypothetical protein
MAGGEGAQTDCVDEPARNLLVRSVDAQEEAEREFSTSYHPNKYREDIRVVHDVALGQEVRVVPNALLQDNLRVGTHERESPLLACKTHEQAASKRPSLRLTLPPLLVEQRFGRLSAAFRLHFAALDALEVERLLDLPVEEQVLHHDEVRLVQRRSALEVADLDGVEADELGKRGRLVCGLVHVLEVGGPELEEDLSVDGYEHHLSLET